MKTNSVAIALGGCLSLIAFASETDLTSSELDHARVYLRQTENGVIGATQGLTQSQWNFKPAPDRWSIAEIVEHMVVVQELVLGPIREQLAKAPAPDGRDNKLLDSIVINQFPDRTAKFQAPDFAKPAGRWTPEVAMDRLHKNYVRLTEYLENTPDLRRHVVEAPPMKAVSHGAYDSMDGYQWILASAAHVERHTKQILEVRADSHFPAK